jgi:cell fate regulator YaaT (PSP1 superfamily)
MGCANCSNGTGNIPNGCKSNGNCGSGGCEKLEVYDWLADVGLPATSKKFDLVEVRFKNARKLFFRNFNQLDLVPGDVVVVEAINGYDVGVVSVTGEVARIQVAKKNPNLKSIEAKKILRIANNQEIEKWYSGRSLEKELMFKSRTMAINLNLDMKISDVEYQGDLTKATFYYTAEGRVDFRQLIKDMVQEFKIRIEMKQIGARQEASRLGGIGSCGRELCCSTWLTEFKSVSTSAARYQQLSLNPQKLAGQCGRLKCCLNFELDVYLDALKDFPKTQNKLKTEKGVAHHFKTDVFKQLMWYGFEGETGLVALTPQRVREINELNKKGQMPKDLSDFIIPVAEKVEVGYSNVVGQDSIDRFKTPKNQKSRRKGNRNRNFKSKNKQKEG